MAEQGEAEVTCVEFTVFGKAAERFPSHNWRQAFPVEIGVVTDREASTPTADVETCLRIRALMLSRYKPGTADRDIDVTLLPTRYSRSKREIHAGTITVSGRTPAWSNAELARVVRAEMEALR